MNGRQQRHRYLAACRIYLALLLFAIPAVSFAGMQHRPLTELSLEELLNVEVAPAVARAERPRADRLSAIRAACADGMNICDALHGILASSAARHGDDTPQTPRAVSYAEESVRGTSAQAVEYNAPPPLDPSMIAHPSHAAFGGAHTVDGALRAIGLGM